MFNSSNRLTLFFLPFCLTVVWSSWLTFVSLSSVVSFPPPPVLSGSLYFLELCWVRKLSCGPWSLPQSGFHSLHPCCAAEHIPLSPALFSYTGSWAWSLAELSFEVVSEKMWEWFAHSLSQANDVTRSFFWWCQELLAIVPAVTISLGVSSFSCIHWDIFMERNLTPLTI